MAEGSNVQEQAAETLKNVHSGIGDSPHSSMSPETAEERSDREAREAAIRLMERGPSRRQRPSVIADDQS